MIQSNSINEHPEFFEPDRLLENAIADKKTQKQIMYNFFHCYYVTKLSVVTIVGVLSVLLLTSTGATLLFAKR